MVLPAPLRPMRKIFSPRMTLAVKPSMTFVSRPLVELGEVLELENVLAAGAHLVEPDVGALDVGAGQFVGLRGARLPCGGW